MTRAPDPDGIVDELARLAARIERLELADRLPSSSIGAGGLVVNTTDGVTISGGGSLKVEDNDGTDLVYVGRHFIGSGLTIRDTAGRALVETAAYNRWRMLDGDGRSVLTLPASGNRGLQRPALPWPVAHDNTVVASSSAPLGVVTGPVQHKATVVAVDVDGTATVTVTDHGTGNTWTMSVVAETAPRVVQVVADMSDGYTGGLRRLNVDADGTATVQLLGAYGHGDSSIVSPWPAVSDRVVIVGDDTVATPLSLDVDGSILDGSYLHRAAHALGFTIADTLTGVGDTIGDVLARATTDAATVDAGVVFLSVGAHDNTSSDPVGLAVDLRAAASEWAAAGFAPVVVIPPASYTGDVVQLHNAASFMRLAEWAPVVDLRDVLGSPVEAAYTVDGVVLTGTGADVAAAAIAADVAALALV